MDKNAKQAQNTDNSFNVYQVSADVDKILSHLTKTQRRQVLATLSGSLGYRLVPFGIPVGKIQTGNSAIADHQKANAENNSSNKKTKKKEKLPWKRDQKWKDISTRREETLIKLKKLEKGSDKAEAIHKELLRINAEMKVLKEELRNKYIGTGGSSSQNPKKA